MGLILLLSMIAGMILAIDAQLAGVLSYTAGFCIVMLLGYAATGLLYLGKKAGRDKRKRRAQEKDSGENHHPDE